MDDAYETQQVGRYRVEIHHDAEWRNLARDSDNVGRFAIPGPRLQWDWQDDAASYREVREQAGEPIVAIPLDIWEQAGCCNIRVRRSWDGADGFYWAPWSAIERESFDGISQLTACLMAEIRELVSELEGDVWGYVVRGPAGEVEESCWGYIGERFYAMSEGVNVAEWANLRDAMVWAALPQWVRDAVLIREEVAA